MDERYKDADWLREMYHEEGLEDSEIAEMCGVNKGTVWRWRKKRFGIESKQKMAGHNDPEWLREKYVDEGLTDREIGEITGVTPSAIGYARERHGIEASPISSYYPPKNIVFNDYGYAVMSSGTDDDNNARLSRLLATLLVDDLSELKGNHVHHHASPYTFLKLVGEPTDLNWLGNIEVTDPSKHVKMTGNTEPEIGPSSR